MDDIKCPVCHTENALFQRSRVLIDNPFGRVLDMRVICKVCPYEGHLRYTTHALEELNDKIKTLERRNRQHIEFHGVENQSCIRRIAILTTDRNNEIERMKRLIKDELSN